MHNIDHYFAAAYIESRSKFRALLDLVQNMWPGANLASYNVGKPEDDLTIDIIRAAPLRAKKCLVILSSGLHGIEGYIGAAVMQLFVREIMPSLSPDHTGLVFVHAINPWGMKHHRRVNENNVDLNRNFIFKQDKPPERINPAYDRAALIFNPVTPLRSVKNPLLLLQLISKMLSMGPARFWEAFRFGQYRHLRGLSYGGKNFEPSTQLMNELFSLIGAYDRILIIDMHSGYGPRYQMTLVNSIHEQRQSTALQEAFAYPLVAKTNPDEFYQMQGDMIDYLYQLVNEKFPEKYFYATSFEFGTYGDSSWAVLKSLLAMINENRLFHYGSINKQTELKAKHDFEELFNPRSTYWREKVLQDSRQAFTGILRAEGFIY